MNQLLQRKANWGAADVTRFAELVSSEHVLTAQEAAARRRMASCEDAAESALEGFTAAMRERYA